MKKFLIVLNLISLCLYSHLYAQSDVEVKNEQLLNTEEEVSELPVKVITDSFYLSISKASSLLMESGDLAIDGKSIKAEKMMKEAVKILDKELYPGRIINSEKICPFISRTNSLWGWRYFAFSCDENNGIIFAFDKQPSMYLKNKKDVTSSAVFEKIEDLSESEEVDASIKLVLSSLDKGNKSYFIDINNNIVVSCQVISVINKTEINEDNDE